MGYNLYVGRLEAQFRSDNHITSELWILARNTVITTTIITKVKIDTIIWPNYNSLSVMHLIFFVIQSFGDDSPKPHHHSSDVTVRSL